MVALPRQGKDLPSAIALLFASNFMLFSGQAGRPLIDDNARPASNAKYDREGKTLPFP